MGRHSRSPSSGQCQETYVVEEVEMLLSIARADFSGEKPAEQHLSYSKAVQSLAGNLEEFEGALEAMSPSARQEFVLSCLQLLEHTTCGDLGSSTTGHSAHILLLLLTTMASMTPKPTPELDNLARSGRLRGLDSILANCLLDHTPPSSHPPTSDLLHVIHRLLTSRHQKLPHAAITCLLLQHLPVTTALAQLSTTNSNLAVSIQAVECLALIATNPCTPPDVSTASLTAVIEAASLWLLHPQPQAMACLTRTICPQVVHHLRCSSVVQLEEGLVSLLYSSDHHMRCCAADAIRCLIMSGTPSVTQHLWWSGCLPATLEYCCRSSWSGGAREFCSTVSSLYERGALSRISACEDVVVRLRLHDVSLVLCGRAGGGGGGGGVPLLSERKSVLLLLCGLAHKARHVPCLLASGLMSQLQVLQACLTGEEKMELSPTISIVLQTLRRQLTCSPPLLHSLLHCCPPRSALELTHLLMDQEVPLHTLMQVMTHHQGLTRIMQLVQLIMMTHHDDNRGSHIANATDNSSNGGAVDGGVTGAALHVEVLGDVRRLMPEQAQTPPGTTMDTLPWMQSTTIAGTSNSNSSNSSNDRNTSSNSNGSGDNKNSAMTDKVGGAGGVSPPAPQVSPMSLVPGALSDEELMVRLLSKLFARAGVEQRALCLSQAPSSDRFSRFINNPELSDVKLRLGDGELLHAHKFALATSGSQLLTSVMEDDVLDTCQGGAIPVPHRFGRAEVLVMLRYLYTLEASFPADLAGQVLEVANFYHLEPLKACAEVALARSIAADNVLPLINQFSGLAAERLHAACLARLLDWYPRMTCARWRDQAREALRLSLTPGCVLQDVLLAGFHPGGAKELLGHSSMV